MKAPTPEEFRRWFWSSVSLLKDLPQGLLVHLIQRKFGITSKTELLGNRITTRISTTSRITFYAGVNAVSPAGLLRSRVKSTASLRCLSHNNKSQVFIRLFPPNSPALIPRHSLPIRSRCSANLSVLLFSAPPLEWTNFLLFTDVILLLFEYRTVLYNNTLIYGYIMLQNT